MEDQKFNPLSKLEGKILGDYSIHLAEIKRGRFREERNFKLFLRDKKGRISKDPVFIGIYFSGRGKWIKPWMEIYYQSRVEFEPSDLNPLDLSKGGIDLDLFKILSSLIPSGGHIMVIYTNHKDTAIALNLGFPPAVTTLGYLLWKSGFRWFKDWYFPEGWMEGDQKLQGNKPLNKEHERNLLKQTASILRDFLNKKPFSFKEIEEPARKRALEILKEVKEVFGYN